MWTPFFILDVRHIECNTNEIDLKSDRLPEVINLSMVNRINQLVVNQLTERSHQPLVADRTIVCSLDFKDSIAISLITSVANA